MTSTDQTQHNIKTDPKSWPCVCFGSALGQGLLGVCSWGPLNALKCEADLFFLPSVSPFFVYSNYTYRDIWSFSVVSMSALGLLWVSPRSALDLFWVCHSRLKSKPEQSQKTNPEFGLLSHRFCLVGTVLLRCSNVKWLNINLRKSEVIGQYHVGFTFIRII